MKTAEEATQDITEVTWQQYEDRQDAIQAFDPTSPLTLFWRGPCILVVATHPAILISAKTTDEGNPSGHYAKQCHTRSLFALRSFGLLRLSECVVNLCE